MNAPVEDTESIETLGKLFFIETADGLKCLVGMERKDQIRLESLGLMEKEIDLTVSKKEYGAEYAQGTCQYRTKASLYTILVDGVTRKPQMRLEPEQVRELQGRGFKNAETVGLHIRAMPYETNESASYQPLKLKVQGFAE